MKFYKYWAKGKATVADVRPWSVLAFGASDISLEDAQLRGNERAERVAAAVVNGRAPAPMVTTSGHCARKSSKRFAKKTTSRP